MSYIDRVSWDSKFFNFEVGRSTIDCSNFNYEGFLHEANKYRLVYGFSKKKKNFKGFRLVDCKIVFHQQIPNYNERRVFRNEMISFDKAKHDIDQLIALTLESGIHSRFRLDKNFLNNEYSKLYREWILKSIDETLAFEILVTMKEEKILGFVTIGKKNNELADIGLIAVDPNSRGLGVGTELIEKAIERAKEKGFNSIQVVTQGKNILAKKLYHKSNFIVKEETYIYHFWNL